MPRLARYSAAAPDQVIVVDNGSTDGSLEYLAAEHPSVRVLALAHNTGFAHAANRRIEAAATEAVALINTDIELDPDWLARMTAALEAHLASAAVACKMVALADRAEIYDAGDILRRDGACEQRGRFMRDAGSYDTPGEVFGACAGAALYRREAVLSVGGFDERFFAYLEDVDLALRLRLSGWSCRYEPAVARHAGEGSSHKLPGGHRRLVQRNTLVLVARTFPLRWLPQVAYRQLGWAWHALRDGVLGDHLRGTLAALPMLPAALRERRALRAGALLPIEQVVARRRSGVRAPVAGRPAVAFADENDRPGRTVIVEWVFYGAGMESALAHGDTENTRELRSPRIGILVVAYNAATTLAGVLDRVPKDFRPQISNVFVCDDASQDATYLVGLGYQQITHDLPLTVIRHPSNLGYGGNQKAGYRLAIEHDLDIVVLLHGDGQYAPESLPAIVAPLERGECDAVFGSRMLEPGAARRGGMPLYKFIGNRILTRFENRMLGTALSEFHSGYRAYSVEALKSIAFESNSDDFNFDTQIIIQLVDSGKRIKEVPIPTYYGDEICYVNGLGYARDVAADVVRYRLSQVGFFAGEIGHVGDEYAIKSDHESSHAIILRWLRQMPPARVLDLGCSGGLLAERVRAMGHHVTGVDALEIDGVRQRVDTFIQANLDGDVPAAVRDEKPFDVVLCADILEHLRQPERLLEEISASLLGPRGKLIASVPNFGHWYARGRTALGLFDYDQRGVLDVTHLRFFTRRGITRRLRSAGFHLLRQQATGLPVEVVFGPGGRAAGETIRRLDSLAVSARPTLFGYQFVFLCERPAEPSLLEAPAR